MARPKSKKSKQPIKKLEVAAPKVSVILTSYNHEKYIAAAIESVLNQTFTDFELLICDDGSSDNSREIIKTFDDPRIKTFLYTENRGPRLVVKESLNAAQGKYLAMHHSDDVWRKDKLQKQVDFLDAHKEYAACFTWADFIDENGNIQNLADDDFYKNRFDEHNRTRAEWLNYFFYQGNCLCHPSLLIRKESYKKYNLYDTIGLWQLPDYSIWIKLTFNAQFFILEERLVLFRLRRKKQENISAVTFETSVRLMTELFWVQREFIDYFKDDEFFLKVFPETKKYLVNGEFNRRFAFAKICLEKPDIEFKFVGLEILKKLLSNSDTAAQIKKLYNYYEKSFSFDTGKYAVLNPREKISVLKSKLYFDTGENFNADEVIEKFISFDNSGNFYAKYNFFSEKPIKNLRFDPCEDFVSIHFNSIAVNGVEQKNITTPFAKYDGKFYNFLTCDPQIIFPVDNLTGSITLEISAEIDKMYPFKLTNYFSENDKTIFELNTEILRLNQWGKDLEHANAEVVAHNKSLHAQIDASNVHIKNLDTQIENLNAQIENLNAQTENLNAQLKAANENLESVKAENHRLNGIINTMLNSNSWKLTKPLRKTGNLFRKIFGKG
ncbi:MAG: glycosyltransferase [Selenomonadaceae bacterium]|nr:glycosyltransferase [Selenomonadaceae bacterium]